MEGGSSSISPLHIAIWNGNVDQVEAALAAGASVETRDRHGHRALHFALQCAHRETRAVVDALVNVGHARPRSRDASGWKALHRAIHANNEDLLCDLLQRENAQVPDVLKAKLLAASAQLAAMPDFTAELDLTVTSWVPMLSSLLPSDTIKLYKSQGSLRVDMTLSGFKSLRWKRGRLSILLLHDRLVTLDHDRQTVRDWLHAPATDADVQRQLHLLLTNRTTNMHVDMASLQLIPRRHWLSPNGPQMTEAVGLWKDARIFDMEGLRVRMQSWPAKAPHRPSPTGATPDVLSPTFPVATGLFDKLQEAETTLEISPGLEHAVPIGMQAGDTIGWKFYLDDHDVEFSVCFVPDEWYAIAKADSDPEKVYLISEVVPEQRVRPTKGAPMQGSHKAKASGNLIVRWDNAHAMFRSKKLHFAIFPILDKVEAETLDVRGAPDTSSHLVTFEQWFGIDRTSLPPALLAMNPKPAIPMHSTPPTSRSTKQLTGTVYLSDTFPLTVLAATSSQFAALVDFFQTKLPPGFPVQVTLPVFPSISATARFASLQLASSPPEWFVVPPAYTPKVSKSTGANQALYNLTDQYMKSAS
ncbi:hypothetical protein SPRG_08156 [Saprolegnia parasitica CBS 223.65]|uniref:Ankyrin repeat domain-containing protein n=1 Tax=Saprolegnia parasitica (strain CBS 223.65) TaxID=695850 RepID=A0A067CJ78_SAPPC|nr:hypothetical protein SPRG_08156 [Saprolegnia parasitica CBS 223.65]KDO26867.1 hypothetical protein SPRG_08156 [Saprolegnia parasitica CBS 223.65]|eukprot:XP_012202510.1 hypothetical protein SPRG_08156 [Saprolegnia parasitica CBS 223.65]